mmetsp:Transcript_18387/g.51034  ORF Transcript_18387/g.51034 Transcript_18387/m.51034 type:complete len:114 (-) Transcript_18387:141-482(-)
MKRKWSLSSMTWHLLWQQASMGCDRNSEAQNQLDSLPMANCIAAYASERRTMLALASIKKTTPRECSALFNARSLVCYEERTISLKRPPFCGGIDRAFKPTTMHAKQAVVCDG